MWPRIIEIMLGCWLAISPMIYAQPPGRTALWHIDLICASATILFALLSLWGPLRHAHLATCGVGLGLIGFGYLGSTYPAPPALQNYIMTGLLLLMLGIIPGESEAPSSAGIGSHYTFSTSLNDQAKVGVMEQSEHQNQHSRLYTIADNEAVDILISKLESSNSGQVDREKLQQAFKTAAIEYKNTQQEQRKAFFHGMLTGYAVALKVGKPLSQGRKG